MLTESELSDADAAAGPSSARSQSELYQIYDASQILSFIVLRNTFVLTLKAKTKDAEDEEEEQQMCLRVTPSKVPILNKLL